MTSGHRFRGQPSRRTEGRELGLEEWPDVDMQTQDGWVDSGLSRHREPHEQEGWRRAWQLFKGRVVWFSLFFVASRGPDIVHDR